MRLIDADAFKEILGTDTKIRETFCKVIDAQPTAYDAEKVMADLEKESDFFGGEPMGSLQKMYYCKGIDKAINIVKGGGVE